MPRGLGAHVLWVFSRRLLWRWGALVCQVTTLDLGQTHFWWADHGQSPAVSSLPTSPRCSERREPKRSELVLVFPRLKGKVPHLRRLGAAELSPGQQLLLVKIMVVFTREKLLADSRKRSST